MEPNPFAAAEFVHKVWACPHDVKPILERNKRPDFLFSIVFLSEVAAARHTLPTKPTPLFRQSRFRPFLVKFGNPNFSQIRASCPANPSQHSSCTQVSPSSARLLSLPPKDDYGCQAETLMCSQ